MKLGSTVTFKCTAYLPRLLSWSFNNRRLPINAEVLRDKPGTLVIRDVKMSNEGVYECMGLLESPPNGMGHFVARGILSWPG